MINITIEKDCEFILSINCEGHSGYDVEGKDIICSAVSVLTQNCIKAINELLKLNAKFVIDEKKPRLYVEMPKNLNDNEMHDVQIILKSTILGLNDLADSYPKYINIKEKRK